MRDLPQPILRILSCLVTYFFRMEPNSEYSPYHSKYSLSPLFLTFLKNLSQYPFSSNSSNLLGKILFIMKPKKRFYVKENYLVRIDFRNLLCVKSSSGFYFNFHESLTDPYMHEYCIDIVGDFIVVSTILIIMYYRYCCNIVMEYLLY